MLIAIALMLLAGGSGEASQPLNLICSGTLTKSVATEQTATSQRSDAHNVGVTIYPNNVVVSSLFAIRLPVTRVDSDNVHFDTIYESQGIKFRIVGGIRANGFAAFNEVFEGNGTLKIWYWELRCRPRNPSVILLNDGADWERQPPAR